MREASASGTGDSGATHATRGIEPAPVGGAPLAPPGIEPGPVGDWIETHLPHLRQPFAFTSIGDGRSNLVARVAAADGTTAILRRPPLGTALASAHDVAREHRILTALAAAGVPVPRPLGLCEDAAVTGAPFLLMEDVPGRVLSRRVEAEALSPRQRRTSARSLMTTLARLHALDVDRAGLGDLARRDAYAERQLSRWRRQWDASRTRELPLVEQVAQRLAAAVPPQSALAVVHGDYRVDNVVLDDDARVRAVLDWELCTLGDPLADLGLLLAYTPRDASDRLPTGDGVMLLPGFPAPDELVADYAHASGRDLRALPFWTALGYWKIAIIAEGVHRRWRDDPRNGSPEIARFPALVELLARRADETAAAAGI